MKTKTPTDAAPPPKKKADPDPIVVKIMQAVRPGDLVIIECATPRQEAHLKNINDQFKEKLPDIHVVVLNAGVRVADVQTLATITEKTNNPNNQGVDK